MKSETSAASTSHFCDCFVNHLVPFVQKCLNALFPAHALAKMLGISSSLELAKLQSNQSSNREQNDRSTVFSELLAMRQLATLLQQFLPESEPENKPPPIEPDDNNLVHDEVVQES